MLVPRRTGRAGAARTPQEAGTLTLVTIAVGGIFAVIGAAAERLASAWPPDEASHMQPGPRTIVLAVLAASPGPRSQGARSCRGGRRRSTSCSSG